MLLGLAEFLHPQWLPLIQQVLRQRKFLVLFQHFALHSLGLFNLTKNIESLSLHGVFLYKNGIITINELIEGMAIAEKTLDQIEREAGKQTAPVGNKSDPKKET